MNQNLSASSAQEAWWAIALSEEITSAKPFGAHIGQLPVVLWRDAQGVARAMEDRCPHRRAPLSLGCVKPDGNLQCGYHGWIFNGETGKVQAIPNAKEQTKFPPMYKAEVMAVREAGGFVWVNANAAAAGAPQAGKGGNFHGVSKVGLDHRQYIYTLLDAPGLLLGIPGVRLTEYVMRDLEWHNGRFRMERNCMWVHPTYSDRWRSDWDMTLQVDLDPDTGYASLELRDNDLNSILTIDLAATPSRRNVTAVRWRAAYGAGAHGLAARGMKLLAGLRGGPVQVFPSVDGEALEKLLEGPSIVYRHYLETQTPGQLAQAV